MKQEKEFRVQELSAELEEKEKNVQDSKKEAATLLIRQPTGLAKDPDVPSTRQRI